MPVKQWIRHCLLPQGTHRRLHWPKPGENQPLETNWTMSEMIELVGKDFKAAIIPQNFKGKNNLEKI